MEQTKTAASAAAEIPRDAHDDVRYRERPHLLSLLAPFILLAASIALAVLADRHLSGLGARLSLRAENAASFDAACGWLLIIVPCIIGLHFLATALECLTTSYAVTDSCVIARSGLLRVTCSTTYLAKVESFVRDQGPIERLFDAGTITLVGTGGGRDTLTNVRGFRRFTAALECAIPTRHAAA